jgi:hypothetical protein
VRKRVEKLCEHLETLPRGPEDLEAARMLRDLAKVYEVAREVVMARTHEHSKAAYAELVDMFKGKPDA